MSKKTNPSSYKKLLLALPLLLNGCSTIYGWTDSVGKHLPTLGEPCNHWQCVTESGQKKSDELKRAETPAPPPANK